MSKFARIVNKVVLEVVVLQQESAISDYFHPDLARQFVPVPDAVEIGWIKGDANNWSAPVPQPAQPTVVVYPVVGVISFKMLFTQPERIKSDELRGSSKELDDFWKLIDDPRTDAVNLNLESVQNAIEGTLMAVKAAGVEVDVQERKAAILSGVLK